MFKTAALLLLLLPCCVFASAFKEHLNHGGGDLKYLQTQEDFKRLGFLSALFDMAEKRDSPAGEIPKILHFIWLGPKPFPESSKAYVQGWIDRHPGWVARFWTDLGQSAPDDRMEVRAFDQFPLEELKKNYYLCDNFGERSHLLRYAVLLSEGGVYIDHDLIPLKAIDSLQAANDFFCGMEPLGPTVLSSSVNPSPHLLASTAQHPILKSAKKWLLEQWDTLEAGYPGSDPSSTFNRVQHRGFRALSMGIKDAYARAGRKDVIYPPNYFSLSDSKHAVFAIHEHAGTWYQEKVDSKAERLLSEVKQDFVQTYGMGLLLAVMNVSLGIVVLKRRKARSV